MSSPIDPSITARLPAIDVAPRVGEDAFVVPAAPLARGGMAEVFEVEDRRLPRNVILKRPRRDPDLGAERLAIFAARLEAEALVLARLQHPSIVTLYEVGRDRRGAPFCVLEKVAGRTLRARLDELAAAEADGRPRTTERLELLAGLVNIAEALAYAHERGIVHRDVTPGNVLLGARGEMTLIDVQPRSATVRVEQPATLYALTNKDLYGLYQNDVAGYVMVLQNICRELSRRLRQADGRICENADSTGDESTQIGRPPARRVPES